jgi:hypothetical protein
MKKEKQIGIRVGLPAFFALEVEDVYKHTRGAHRALAFPDFLGYLVGLGLETYKKSRDPEKEAPEGHGAAGEDMDALLKQAVGLVPAKQGGNFTPLYIPRRYV